MKFEQKSRREHKWERASEREKKARDEVKDEQGMRLVATKLLMLY